MLVRLGFSFLEVVVVVVLVLVRDGAIEEEVVGFSVDVERGEGSDLCDCCEGVGGRVAERVGGDYEGPAGACGGRGGGESEEDDHGGDREAEEERSHGGEVEIEIRMEERLSLCRVFCCICCV